MQCLLQSLRTVGSERGNIKNIRNGKNQVPSVQSKHAMKVNSSSFKVQIATNVLHPTSRNVSHVLHHIHLFAHRTYAVTDSALPSCRNCKTSGLNRSNIDSPSSALPFFCIHGPYLACSLESGSWSLERRCDKTWRASCAAAILQ